MAPVEITNLLDMMAADGLDDLFVPAQVTQQLAAFSGSIGADGTFHRVPVWPFDKMQNGRCFDNCTHLEKVMGGKTVHGWAWHQVADLFVVAEFHGVWRAPDDQLIDVTPPYRPRTETVFSEDPVRVAADVPNGDLTAALKVGVPNRRFALKDIPEVREWISAEEGHAVLSRRRLEGEILTYNEVIQVLERNADARAKIVAMARRSEA